MPISPISPIMAMNVNGCRNTRSAGIIPKNTNGKHVRISNTSFQRPNNSNSMPNIIKIVIGRYLIMFPVASNCTLVSPANSIVYPAGSRMDFMSSSISDTAFATVPSYMSVFGSASTSIERTPFTRKTKGSSQSTRTFFVTHDIGRATNILSRKSSTDAAPLIISGIFSGSKLTFIIDQTGISFISSIIEPSSFRTFRLTTSILSSSFTTPTGSPSVAASMASATFPRLSPAFKASACSKSAT